ncbi:MAG: cyclase family protein [Pseudobdellovibrionaceae bacterium]
MTQKKSRSVWIFFEFLLISSVDFQVGPVILIVMKIHDISPLIHEKTAVFPGDTTFQRQILMDTKAGDHLGLSWIKSTLHLGAHVDASNHYHPDGHGIAEADLGCYIGPCQVIQVRLPRNHRITVDRLEQREITAPKVLFRTDSFPDPDFWNSDFNSLSPELIDFLASKKVHLVGIDTPSVDPETSKALESHQALWKNKMSVLEGIVLTTVKEGIYQLVALPLKIKDADASPVRAVLIES